MINEEFEIINVGNFQTITIVYRNYSGKIDVGKYNAEMITELAGYSDQFDEMTFYKVPPSRITTLLKDHPDSYLIIE